MVKVENLILYVLPKIKIYTFKTGIINTKDKEQYQRLVTEES